MAHINLLPWREAQRARAKKQYLTILGGVAALGALMVLVANLVIGEMVDLQQQRNAYLQQEIQELDVKIAEIQRIKEQQQLLLKRIEVIQALQRQRHVPVQVMNELARVMVPGVYLTRVEVKGHDVSMEGYCDSNNHLANMMRRVETAHWLAEPRIHKIVAADNINAREHAFKLDVKVLPLGNGPREIEPQLAMQGE
ncbi:PilN domain-containing protein [Ferrimonas gelatinilytica]|uniref:PilN domain-containing protein n=1 Tax=Ferrimonas gelatinilytica TaxID=1255257 RepID=A0ABP9SB45_9GAMM